MSHLMEYGCYCNSLRIVSPRALWCGLVSTDKINRVLLNMESSPWTDFVVVVVCVIAIASVLFLHGLCGVV